MLDIKKYKSQLSSTVNQSFGDMRKKQSRQIIDATFPNDPNYKKVRVLTSEGQKVYDAKYQHHSNPSISKDVVDQYIQFKSGVQFPIGTYVIIPGEHDEILETQEDQVKQFKADNRIKHIRNGDRPQLQVIVLRDEGNQCVRYNILQCNQNFQQIYNGQIKNCIGILKTANSYTSGVWVSDRSVQLDNLTACQLPDLQLCYGDKLSEFKIDDNRSITHGVRFMLTNNTVNPEVYVVTKVVDTAPSGVIKLSIKQDEYNVEKDNVSLLICDYYNQNRQIEVDEPKHYDPTVSEIILLTLDESTNMLGNPTPITDIVDVPIGINTYFGLNNQSGKFVPNQKLTLSDDSKNDKHPDSYYVNLVRIVQIDAETIALRPGKASSLVGKKFELCTYDSDGNSYSKIELEVSQNAT